MRSKSIFLVNVFCLNTKGGGTVRFLEREQLMVLKRTVFVIMMT